MRRPDAALTVATLSLALSAAFIIRRPDLTQGAAFLFSDEAANLFVADALHHGSALYSGTAYPYGPLAIRAYSTVAALAGNAPVTYLWTLAVLAAVSAWLCARVIARVSPPPTAVAVAVAGLLPTMPLPGATIGGYTSSIYMPIERVGLLVAALLWSAPERRRTGTSVAIGCVLGLCQGVRFGTGAVMVAAVVVADLLGGRMRSSDRRVPPWRASAGVLAGFLAIEALWAAWAFVTLPRPYAIEFLWPMQMWETHRVAVGVPRWPTWGGWRMAATQYALPASAAALAVAAASRWLRRGVSESRVDVEGRAVVLLLFYVLGAIAFFRHEHHFRQFAWMLVPAAAAFIAAMYWPMRVVVLVVWSLALWPVASALLHRPAPEVESLAVPRGYALSVRQETVARVEFLDRYRDGGPVVILPNGAGWFYAYGVPHVSRHTWFYSRAVVRPFETAAFTRDLDGAVHVIDCGAGDDAGWPLPPPAIAAIHDRFERRAAGGGCVAWSRYR